MTSLRTLPRDFLTVLRDSVHIWWLAPLVPLLVVVPEAIQHIAEIRIGMFESRDMARAVSDDPRRMVWGYLKIAGLVLATLAAIRFWGAQRSSQRWWDLRGLAWRELLLSFGLLVLLMIPGLLLQSWFNAEQTAKWVDGATQIAGLPLFVMLVAAIGGDRSTGLRQVYRHGWLPAFRAAIFVVAVWLPLIWLHKMNHRWAMGSADVQVWALMAFDSIVVGFMAVIAGTAIHHGCFPPPRGEQRAPASPATR